MSKALSHQTPCGAAALDFAVVISDPICPPSSATGTLRWGKQAITSPAKCAWVWSKRRPNML